MNDDYELTQTKKQWHGTYKSYVAGFIFSLILTIISFLLVVKKWYSSEGILATILGLAIFQAWVQLFYFLHLGKEAKPHWHTSIFLLMGLTVLILVIGSLWIMFNLKARVM